MRTPRMTYSFTVVAGLVFLQLGSSNHAGMACLNNSHEALCTELSGEGMASACKRLDDGTCALIFQDADLPGPAASLTILHVEALSVTSFTPDADAALVPRRGEPGSHRPDVDKAYGTHSRRGSILSAFLKKISVYTSLVGLPGQPDGVLECEVGPPGEVTVTLRAAAEAGDPLVSWHARVWRLKGNDVLLIPSTEAQLVDAVSVEWISDTDLERTPRGSMSRFQRIDAARVDSVSE